MQVIDKSSGEYKVSYTVGSSRDNSEIKRLVAEGQKWIQPLQVLFHLQSVGKENSLT